jgi:ATP-dependent exoDNAse (exonuclease V) beta subunit
MPPVTARITFISAGAGSGKTHRLTDILYRELRSQQVQPAGVIATTFTRKAAAELRERVRSHLLKQGDMGLANAMGQARIGTINSVCGQLLERFSFEAGMAPQQRVLEESQAKALLNQAIDRVLHGERMADFLAVARRLGLEEKGQQGGRHENSWLDDLRRIVDQLRTNDIAMDRARDFAAINAQELLDNFPKATQSDLSGELKRLIPSTLATLADAESKTKVTTEYVSQLRDFGLELSRGSVPWSAWAKLAKSAPEKNLKTCVEGVTECVARYAEHPDLHQDLNDYLRQVFDLAIDALTIYGDSKRELGALDFADQEHALLNLLDHPTVAQVLDDELDLVMVDEFQDTSPMQLALFLKLARFAKRVYWVGDIKQAIYGFRGSDSALMQSILSSLTVLGGHKEILPLSWRSRPELVQLVNEAFSHAFSKTLPRAEVELKPNRKDQLAGPAFANWLLEGKNADLQVGALVTGIGKLIDEHYEVFDKAAAQTRPVRLDDITVLCYSHANVAKVASALAAARIPCSTAQAGLLATAEATLALACLRRLNDPADTLATAEIVALADGTEPETWVADRLRYLDGNHRLSQWLEETVENHTAHPLVAKLAALRAHLPLLAPAEALQTVIAECDLPARVVRWSASPAQAQTRLANLDALIELAQQYEELCRSARQAASISGLVLWLGETARQNNDPLATPAIDAVRVMTHHAAKGLEWPVVILMDLARSVGDRLWSVSARSGSAFDPQRPLEDRFIRYWPWPFGLQQKIPLADTIAETKVAKEFRTSAVEEAKRLLYVSMTRARDLLVLARPSQKPSGEWLECIDAPWLLPQEDATHITLPDGQTLKADYWKLTAVEALVQDPASFSGVHWFAPVTPQAPRLPLGFSPSSSAAQPHVTARETCNIGYRLTLNGKPNMSVLGTAIHACLGLSFTDPNTPLVLDEVQRILKGYGMEQHVNASQVLEQSRALHAWIAARWPHARAMAEYPVQQVLASRQVLNGRLDLLLDIGDGWVLIDHKSSPKASASWDQLAGEYAGQLQAYAHAITRASGRPVKEAWIFLPTAAGAFRVL